MNEKIMDFLADQFRRPTGFLGKFISKKMQERNNDVYKWMISLMNFDKAKNVLEVGYGTGKVLAELAETYKGINFYGIDFSEVMYKIAFINNIHFIENSRIVLEYGDLLEYKSRAAYDVIYCINVIYFWNDLKSYLLKLHSLLNSGGTIYIYMTDEKFVKQIFGKSTVFNKYSIDYVMQIIDETGFSNKEFETGNIGNRIGYSISAVK